MNWLPNDSSSKGTSSLECPGVCTRKIRTLEMPLPAICALNYELQFDSKKEKPWTLCSSEFNFFPLLLTKANRGVHPCAHPCKSTPV
jgi:hypothetical protein